MAPRVLLVLSGKGGVGKSTVSAQMALALAMKLQEDKGQDSATPRVGVLDADLTGPSLPRVLCGAPERWPKVLSDQDGLWVPPRVSLAALEATSSADSAALSSGATATPPPNGKNGQLSVMSVGFLLPEPDAAVVWRGPKKTAMIGQLLSNVSWGADLEWLVVDTPPGTGDEHISLVQTLQELQRRTEQGTATGGLRIAPGPAAIQAVLVTTPQAVSVGDVLREASFCKKIGVPILGVIENMSGFECPCCGDVTNIFSSGGGALLAERVGTQLLGTIPINPALATAMDSGEDSALSTFVARTRNGPGGVALQALCDILLQVNAQA
jgi:Mrp family chromosome partitioning ATPase